MRLCARYAVISAVSFASTVLGAQEFFHFHDPDVIARLSYRTSPVVQRDSLQQICVALSHDGTYRLLRIERGPGHKNQRSQGKLTADQFGKIKELLDSPDFSALSGMHGGMIVRQDFESFGAEISLPGWHEGQERSKRFQWLNPDDENPLPAPVAKIVDWLKDFHPTNGVSFDLAEYPDVCPSGGLRMLQPDIALNLHP